MSDDWNMYIDGSAVVIEFEAGIETTSEVFARVNEKFEEVAPRPDVDTHISVLEMESPLSGEVFEKAQEAARAGTEHGITTWIIVSEGIKNKALKSQVGQIEGVDIETVATVDEALALAN